MNKGEFSLKNSILFKVSYTDTNIRCGRENVLKLKNEPIYYLGNLKTFPKYYFSFNIFLLSTN